MPTLTFRKKVNDMPVPEKQRKKSAGSFFASLKSSILPTIPRAFSKPLELNTEGPVLGHIDTAFPEAMLPIGDLNTCPSERRPEFISPRRSPIPSRRLARSASPRSASTVHDLIPGKLCIAFHPTNEFSCAEIKRRPDLYFFSTNLHERYIPFFKDFGPVSLGTMFLFWEYVRSKEHHPLLRGRPLVYYTDADPKNQANAAVLLGAYMMLEHNMSADETAKAFEKVPQHSFVPFQDISNTTNFVITVRDCLEALEKAVQVGWFDKTTFDVETFMDLEDPHNGDMSLIGDKFVAFRGPNTNADAEWSVSPSKYQMPFQSLGVTCVVRLNETSCYDKEEFVRQGLVVHDLEFEDCSCPSPAQIERFLDICDRAEGRVAVHCKAGLGRTGTMIGLWMMKHLGFSARQAIAWLRLSRPGSVIGRQQNFLALCEHAAWHGNLIELRATRARSHDSVLSCLDQREADLFVGKEKLGRQVDEASRKRAALRMKKSSAKRGSL